MKISEIILPNTLELCITFLVFFSSFYAVQRPTSWLNSEVQQTSSFIYSMILIAFGYHFAHYLPTFIVDIQYAIIALSYPFTFGWNLLGTANWKVSSSYLANYHSAVLIWYIQISGIVLVHVEAVIVCLLLQLHTSRSWGDPCRDKFRQQYWWLHIKFLDCGCFLHLLAAKLLF